MNDRQLLYFLTVYNDRSIKKAAEDLQISEQAVSKTIIQFEKSLNLKLFNRGAHSIEPTDAAHRIQKSASRILDEIGTMMQVNPSNGLPEALTIYAVENTAEALTYSFLNAFMGRYPTVLLNFMEVSEDIATEGLKRDDVELAILNHAQDPRTFENVKLFSFPYCALIHKDNPLAENEFIYNRDLDGQYVVTNGRSYDSYVNTSLKILNSDIHFVPRLETNSNYFIYEMAERGEGIGLILENAVSSLPLKNTVVRPIENPNIFTYYFCWKKNASLSSSALKFKSFLLDWVSYDADPVDELGENPLQRPMPPGASGDGDTRGEVGDTP